MPKIQARHRLVPSTGGDFFVDASLDDRGVRALSECPVTRTILDSRFMGAVWHAGHCPGVILVEHVVA
ncbi:8738_t:CDS:2 [Entrophospora sp. SA101]|nr:8738_t:CDS:2 [Entrophospora sp. SA101]